MNKPKIIDLSENYEFVYRFKRVMNKSFFNKSLMPTTLNPPVGVLVGCGVHISSLHSITGRNIRYVRRAELQQEIL